jgi:hypothetical protein
VLASVIDNYPISPLKARPVSKPGDTTKINFFENIILKQLLNRFG